MRRLQAIETFPRKVELPVITQMSFLPAVEVVTLWVNVVVVGLVIFDDVVDFFVDDPRLAFLDVVVDFCTDFVHGGSDVFDVAVDHFADVVDVCCS